MISSKLCRPMRLNRDPDSNYSVVTSKSIHALTEPQNNDMTPIPIYTRKRIGSTVYEVSVHFNQDAKETMEDKVLRLIKTDLLFASDNTILGLPQTGRLPERGSS